MQAALRCHVAGHRQVAILLPAYVMPCALCTFAFAEHCPFAQYNHLMRGMSTWQVLKAWQLLLECTSQLLHQETFLYDLVDVTRQALSKHATSLWLSIVAAYSARELQALEEQGQLLLDLLDDMELLLSSNRYGQQANCKFGALCLQLG